MQIAKIKRQGKLQEENNENNHNDATDTSANRFYLSFPFKSELGWIGEQIQKLKDFEVIFPNFVREKRRIHIFFIRLFIVFLDFNILICCDKFIEIHGLYLLEKLLFFLQLFVRFYPLVCINIFLKVHH